MKNKKIPDISSAGLHIAAMAFMLLDHMWATVVSGNDWMTCIGRLAFPIFAFMIAEGYRHTHDIKKYMLRMLIFAVISEVPFDLMYGGTWFDISHQNVMWTFLIALAGMWTMDRIRAKKKIWLSVIGCAGVTALCGALGFLLIVDYYGAGVLTVFVFYFLRERKWWCFIGQAVLLYFLNVKLIGGLFYSVTLFGQMFEISQQGLALFALLPIWLYRGRQGHHSKPFKYFCYAFYPVHILVLAVIGRIM